MTRGFNPSCKTSFHIRLPGAGARVSTEGSSPSVHRLPAGMPDRIVLLPGAHLGFVEVKAPGQKPRALQLRRHKQLRQLGFPVFILDDPDQIAGIIKEVSTWHA